MEDGFRVVEMNLFGVFWRVSVEKEEDKFRQDRLL